MIWCAEALTNLLSPERLSLTSALWDPPDRHFQCDYHNRLSARSMGISRQSRQD